MTDDSGSVLGEQDGRRSDQHSADHDVAAALTGASERERAGPLDDIAHLLLISYIHAIDAIAVKPAIVFGVQGSARGRRSSWRIALPRANFIAEILAESHAAARVDALLHRAQRLEIVDPGGRGPLDLNRIEDFKDSLTPVRRRTLAAWIILCALAVAFPVAWVTDYIRAFAPEVIVCSSRFGFRAIVAKFLNATVRRGTVGCRAAFRGSLVEALVHVAHAKLSPGSVIDALLSVRASGLVSALLLAVVLILSLTTVLLVFRSVFRLKRLAFSAQQQALGDYRPSLWARIGPGSVYSMEREVFTALGLEGRRGPREFPLDLVVSAGVLILPLTIAADLLVNAAVLLSVGPASAAELMVVGFGLILVVVRRLGTLVRLWRDRIGLAVIGPQERLLPNGSTVLVRSGVYGAVLLAAAQSVWAISRAAAVRDPGSLKVRDVLA